jgi:hypothetical protein
VNHLTNPVQEISSLQPPEIFKEKASRELKLSKEHIQNTLQIRMAFNI